VFIPVTFAATAMTMVAEAMFGCSALATDLQCAPILLEEALAYTCSAAEQLDSASLQIPARHFKDPSPPWHTPRELSEHCLQIVADLGLGHTPSTSPLFSFAQPIRWQPPPEGIILVELFGGIGTGLAAVLEVGLRVKKYIHVDNGYTANRAVRHHIQQLLLRYPTQLPASSVHGCCGQLPQDVTLISDEDLRRLGHIDLLIAGWPCQGHSRAGAGQGLNDPRSSLFADLMRLTQWWFTHQSTPPGYIFENVPSLGDTRQKVVNDGKYISQLLGTPTFVDAAALGSYAHRPRWFWTNLVPSHVLSGALARIPRPVNRKVDDILDDHRVSLAVFKDDTIPLALINKVGIPRGALPTFVTYPQSFAFRSRGPSMVWDSRSQTHDEPTADERERAMGFPTGTTAAHGLQEGQRRFLLGQAMDLNTMVWIIGICLAAQQCMDGQLLTLRAEHNGQGAMEPQSKLHMEANDAEALFSLKQHVAEELRAQRVFAALAQDFGKLEAEKMFPLLFLGDTSHVDSYLATQTDCSGEDSHLVSNADAGGKCVAPSTD
jgi:site-specific DNA-cytosine methylase